MLNCEIMEEFYRKKSEIKSDGKADLRVGLRASARLPPLRGWGKPEARVRLVSAPCLGASGPGLGLGGGGRVSEVGVLGE